MGDIVPREELTRQAMKGVGGIAGGVALLVVRGIIGALSSAPIGLFVIGGIVAVIGLIMTRNRADRKAGLVALAAGGITVLAFAIPGIRGLALGLLLLSGIGLLGAGVYSLVKFLKNLKRQS